MELWKTNHFRSENHARHWIKSQDFFLLTTGWARFGFAKTVGQSSKTVIGKPGSESKTCAWDLRCTVDWAADKLFVHNIRPTDTTVQAEPVIRLCKLGRPLDRLSCYLISLAFS